MSSNHDFAHGFKQFRRRETPILVQECQRWRLRKAGVSHYSKLWDVANAFPSTSPEALDKATTRRNGNVEDTEFLKQRYRSSYSLIEGQAAETILLKNGCGTMQGDKTSPDLVGEDYNEIADGWISLTPNFDDKELKAFDPISRQEVLTELTGYADDIQRTCAIDNPLDLEKSCNFHGDILDACLEEPQLGQNYEKGEIMPTFLGKNARRYNLAAYNNFMLVKGKVKKRVKYLGAWSHSRGSNKAEVQSHIRAMQKGWCSMGSFWWPNSKKKIKQVVFGCMITNPAESGLEAAAFADSEITMLEKARIGYLRKINRGHGNGITNNKVTKRLTDDELRQHWEVATIDSSIRTRRLKWLQVIGRLPQHHKQLIATLTGKTWYSEKQVTDEGWPMRLANPWITQFTEDLVELVMHASDPEAEKLLAAKGFFFIFTKKFQDLDVQCVKSFKVKKD